MDDGLKAMLDHLRQTFPAARIRLDAPDSPKGEHWIDLTTDAGRISFAWRPQDGFGFFASDAVFGDGPATIVRRLDDALPYAERYIRQALDTRKKDMARTG